MNRTEISLLGSKKAALRNKREGLKRIKSYNKSPSTCNFCGCALNYEKRNNRYCSHSCSAKINNLGICRNERKPDQICLNCNNKFKSCAESFCSVKCANEYKWKKWCECIESSGIFEGYNRDDSGSKVARPKRYILEKQIGKCAVCGIDKWCGKPVPFVLDHIDGNPDNWKVDNMRVVCRNCDGQLDTYCGKNINRNKRCALNIQKTT